MALSEIFFLAIVFYLLYRFVFNFLVPVVRTTRQVRQQFRDMQERAPQEERHAEPKRGPAARKPAGEYIDFEDVKE